MTKLQLAKWDGSGTIHSHRNSMVNPVLKICWISSSRRWVVEMVLKSTNSISLVL